MKFKKRKNRIENKLVRGVSCKTWLLYYHRSHHFYERIDDCMTLMVSVGDKRNMCKGCYDYEVCVWGGCVCVWGVCTHTCSHMRSAGLPCGGGSLFHPESLGIAVLKSEVCIIWTMVCFNIFSSVIFKRRVEELAFKNELMNLFSLCCFISAKWL